MSDDTADALHMDHVRLNFWEYLWAHCIIGPGAEFLWFFGILKLFLRQWLHRKDVISMVPFSAELVVGKLLLESIGEAIHYTGQEYVGGKKVAVFVWKAFVLMTNDGDVTRDNALTVQVELEQKRMIRATLNSDSISAQDALVLICFDTIFVAHPKIHALANWGINVEGGLDRFAKQHCVVTIIYNYFGYTIFPRLAARWVKWRWSSYDHRPISHVIDTAVGQGVNAHSKLGELAQYSTTISFIIKIRNHFLNTFAEFKHDFPGIDGEAFFAGTVMHSLDHQCMEWNIVDPLWIYSDTGNFAAMAELGRFVRVGFVEDTPMTPLLFTVKYKNAKGRFYKIVYNHARRINRKYADEMDTCIVK